MDDGGDLGKGACCAELVNGFGTHEMVCGHPEPCGEGCEAVNVGLTALGQAGERGCADSRLRRHIFPGEAAGTALGVQCRVQRGDVKPARAGFF